MGNRISNGFELSRQSWSALMQNKQLLAFPAMSLVASIIVMLIALLILAVTGILGGVVNAAEVASSGDGVSDNVITDAQAIIAIIVVLAAGFINTFIVLFSNTALIANALRLSKGKEATIQDGINLAMKRLPQILIFTTISTIVNIIAGMLRNAGNESGNIVGAIIGNLLGGLLEGAWNLMVFFAVPVIVAEDAGPIDAIKGGWNLFKATWGESFVGSTTIGGIGCIASVVVILAGGAGIALGVALNSAIIIGLFVTLIIIGLVVIGLFQGAVNGIFRASLYEYAKTGDAGRFIDTELARDAFR